jgi:hypothetical protein
MMLVTIRLSYRLKGKQVQILRGTAAVKEELFQ